MKYKKCEICNVRSERKDGKKRFFIARFPLDEARKVDMEIKKMVIGLKKIISDLDESKYDEINELPLMRSIEPVMMILVGYLLFVLKLGPKLMRNREAFKLTTTLIVYNTLQVQASAYLVQFYFRGLLKTGLVPEYCPMNDEIVRKEVFLGIYMYFAAKVTELLDTVFIVLRKKDRQVTFLHLYHHSVMMVGSWAFLKYWPSHNLFFIGFMNSLVHTFMYTYYGLAALDPNVTKNLKWKKYMTKFQLVQFFSIIVHYITSVRVSNCPPAKGVSSFVACNTFFFLILFLNFYRQSYKKKSTKAVDVCSVGYEVDGKEKIH